MGNVLLLVAILLLVAAIVWASDRARKDELGRYAWHRTSFTDPRFHEVELATRSSAVQSLIALDALDLTPAAAGYREACALCVGRVAHTDAACVAARQRWGEIPPHEAGWWVNTGRGLRAFLAAIQVPA